MFDSQDLLPPTAASDGHVAAPPHPSAPVHLLDRLNAIFRHRRLAGAAFVVVVTLLTVQSYTTVPEYRTSARVVIQDERTVAVGNLNANDPMFWQESDQFYNTQYSILRSRALAKRVVGRLHLDQHPLFTGAAPASRGPRAVLDGVRERASAGIRRLLRREPAASGPGAAAGTETSQESALISRFLAGVSIVPEKSSRLVDVVYTSTDAAFAALAANTLADEYAQQNLDLRLENIRRNLAWLGEEVRKQEAKVRDAEAAMTSYREQQNALSLGDRQNIVVARLNQLNETVTRSRTARLQKETLYNQVRNVDPTSDAADAFPVIAGNAGVVEAKNRLAELNAQRAQMSSRYRTGHPEMAKIDTQIESARAALNAQRARVIESVRNDYTSAVNEERSFAAQLDAQKGAAMDLDRKSGAYLVLERDAESNRQIYQALLQQEKELRVISNSRTNNVQVMDRAEVPVAPFAPNRRRDLFTAILAGLVAGVALAFGAEYLDDTVKTPEDVSRRLKLPLLGLVPAVRGPVPVLAGEVPHVFGEAFRSLRTSIVFTSASDGPRLIVVTSSQPLEGKTTTACNVAMALALGGARVLLIDADMRRPGLHKLLGIANDVGLSHVLVGQFKVREALQATPNPNLFVIPAGRIPPNPSELLSSERMHLFLTNLQTGPFDWVIIDTPPVLAVTDAVLIARAVSGVVYVIGSEMTRRIHAERALEMLMTGRPKSIGAVLNRVDFERNKYYYSRYYGYSYHSDYGESSSASV